MNIMKLNDDISVAGEFSAADVQAIADFGFKTIVCNRPDGESFGQTRFSDIEAAAKAAGIKAVYAPIHPSGLSMSDIRRFGTAMDDAEGPVLAYCRSGVRSTTMWALDQALRGADIDELQKTAGAAGFSLGGMAVVLASLQASAA